jgi:hypothetical protein
MNILIIGRDYFSLSRDPAHSTVVIGQPDVPRSPPDTPASLIQRHCPTFSPDIVLHTDESRLPTLAGLEDFRIPLFGFFIDSHIHYCWHREYAGIFDHVFVAQKDCCDSIDRHTANCSWLPLFASPDASGCEKVIHDVSFVGTLDRSLNPERVRFIQSLGAMVPLFVHTGAFSRIFRQSRIVLNQSVKTDINFRVFEVLASGSLLLTDNVGNGMESLLEEGKHFVSYRKNDPRDAADKIRYYLEHEEERRTIARSGHVALLARHSTDIRRRQVMDRIGELLSRWGGRDPRRPQLERKYAAARTWLNVARLAADLERECGIMVSGRDGYVELAEKCLQLAKGHGSIEHLVRDLAWIQLLQGKTDSARSAIEAALRMGAADIETLLCAASLTHDHDKTKQYLAAAIQSLQQYRGSDPLYYGSLYDRVLLCAKHAGLL